MGAEGLPTISFDEQLEVLALTGNIGVKDGDPALHAHVVPARSDGTAHGGHLLEASVRPTLEVVAVETPDYLQRCIDRVTGLALVDLTS